MRTPLSLWTAVVCCGATLRPPDIQSRAGGLANAEGVGLYEARRLRPPTSPAPPVGSLRKRLQRSLFQRPSCGVFTPTIGQRHRCFCCSVTLRSPQSPDTCRALPGPHLARLGCCSHSLAAPDHGLRAWGQGLLALWRRRSLVYLTCERSSTSGGALLENPAFSKVSFAKGRSNDEVKSGCSIMRN